jgi:hypothetical protein
VFTSQPGRRVRKESPDGLYLCLAQHQQLNWQKRQGHVGCAGASESTNHAAPENVPDVYRRSDESPAARHDPTDAPRGPANPFAFCAPSLDQRRSHIGGRRTRIDRAHCDRHLAGIDDPDAKTIVLVMFGPTRTHCRLDSPPCGLGRRPGSSTAVWPPGSGTATKVLGSTPTLAKLGSVARQN